MGKMFLKRLYTGVFVKLEIGILRMEEHVIPSPTVTVRAAAAVLTTIRTRARTRTTIGIAVGIGIVLVLAERVMRARTPITVLRCTYRPQYHSQIVRTEGRAIS